MPRKERLPGERLRILQREWSRLTIQAIKIRERKREMRETVEMYFNGLLPKLNAELKKRSIPYYFHPNQTAGYTLDGPLSFALHAIPLMRPGRGNPLSWFYIKPEKGRENLGGGERDESYQRFQENLSYCRNSG